MMKKKKRTPVVAGLLCGALLVGTVSLPASVLLAGEQLGQTDFENGVGLPWHIVESAPAEMEFAIENGVYQITIVNPGGRSRGGEDRWDCQFRHRGLKIVAGHQYKVHYEITASNSGKYYTKIGNLQGNVEIWHNMSNGYDLDSTWDPIPISANQKKVVDLTFTANQSMDVAEWAFHLGGDGQYTNGDCFPAGTVITFDNMSLIDLSSDENDYHAPEGWERAGILTNQLGYFTGCKKEATLLSDESAKGIKFELVDEKGDTVYEGVSTVFGNDPDSGDAVHILDFSDYTGSGIFTLRAKNGAVSRSFAIGNSEGYSAMLYDALNYFYQNRSGIAIEKNYITSGDTAGLARAAGHAPDNATIEQTWGYSGSSGTQDVTGGWYDAGDHGKYVVNGGIALWMLQNTYEMALAGGYEAAFADGTMNLPENANKYPDLLDEARYEMEWMMKMLVKDGSYQDMAYHKVHDEAWTGLGIAPAEDTQARIIKPPTTAATLNVSACAAQAARLWKGIDDAFAKTCEDVAKRTYEAAKKHPEMYAPLDESIGGGAYGDNDATDEFYWAACELFLTTGEKSYQDDMEKSSWYLKLPTTIGAGEHKDTCGSFDWGNVAALGTLSVALSEDAPNAMKDKAVDNICQAADTYLALEKKQGYGLPYAQSTISYKTNEKGYVWGSNSFVVDNGVVLAYAYQLSGQKAYLNGAIGAMDYLLGRNPMDYSYVTGYGSHAIAYPHHRYWAKLIDDKYPLAPYGVLSGGPNSGMEDPWVNGSGFKSGEIAPQKCYLDHIEAWSVNECTINWNAPLVWLTAYVAQGNDDGIILGATGNGAGVNRNTQDTGNTTNPDTGNTGNTGKTDQGSTGNQKTDNTETKQSVKGDDNKSTDSEKNTSTKNTEEKNKSTDNDNSSSKDNKLLIIIVVAVAVLAVVISVEVTIVRLVKLKERQ